MQLNIDDALRYLGVRSDPNGSLRAQMDALSGEVMAQHPPRSLWRLMDVSALALPGRTAEKILAECRQAAVMVCTLGAAFDAWVRAEQSRDMRRAVMLDALGSAWVEAGCDAVENAIRARFPGMYLTDRFSPGYGDLPLEVQPLLLDITGARRIGVTVLDSLLMHPQKSVSAVIGLADKPQKARIRGCAYCAMNKTCSLRKAGTPCGI
ncbi:MAG: methionine synthase [Clostridia bacterium]|nr:methionine synthase [Clostridia bacterium]